MLRCWLNLHQHSS